MATGEINFHNSGDNNLYYYYVFTGYQPAEYFFCDVAQYGGTLSGHSNMKIIVPPERILNWCFFRENKCDFSAANEGHTSHEQANGGLINVG